MSFNVESGDATTLPMSVTTDGRVLSRELGTPEDESALRKEVRKARNAEKKKEKGQGKKVEQ